MKVHYGVNGVSVRNALQNAKRDFDHTDHLCVDYGDDIYTGESVALITRYTDGRAKILSDFMPVILTDDCHDLDVMKGIFGIDWRSNELVKRVYQILLIPLPTHTDEFEAQELAALFKNNSVLSKYNEQLADFYSVCFGTKEFAFEDPQDFEILIGNEMLNKAVMREFYEHTRQLRDGTTLCPGRICDELRRVRGTEDTMVTYMHDNMTGIIEMSSSELPLFRVGNSLLVQTEVNVDTEFILNSPLKEFDGIETTMVVDACKVLFCGNLFTYEQVVACINEIPYLLRRRDLNYKMYGYRDMYFLCLYIKGVNPRYRMPCFPGMLFPFNKQAYEYAVAERGDYK